MKYQHLIFGDRLKIQQLLLEGNRYKKIADAIGKVKSTVYYEVSTKGDKGNYNAKLANLYKYLPRKNKGYYL